ncbi:MAG: bifunctional 23S rRNA (guanine(2069)-N(7))-methyltransferase RlmK/23S rRNA (guanine(2445)-N(2))-methyltransferase RlmL [Granulosicoccus sp.]|nr:bifunctional 23S rRNA (guanine(2069)-N(7))-methyltransferase RlmK/23S rRNA (guanine(2445)-N(2))-methyltransferase RlmL [Granulosicoccus sp.]
MAPAQHILFASSPRNLEPLLASELRALGISGVKPVASGCQFDGDLAAALKVCLWSRVANRVLFPVTAGRAADPEELYALIQTVDWSSHLRAEQTLAVDFFCAQSNITHSHYGALKVKDAIVDQFREQSGVRPSVDRQQPDVCINVYLHRNRARVAIDLSGQSLHRRGYRSDGARAPLKENLAAALLLACDWPARAARGESFIDPLCGSGTLVIEAMMMASNTAPGLLRPYYGFTGWLQHLPELWQELIDEATDLRAEGMKNVPYVAGSDQSRTAIASATDNVLYAGFADVIELQTCSLERLQLPAKTPSGLVLTNPPYGIRVQEQQEIGQLYSIIGQHCKKLFPGWSVALFTGAPKLLHRTRLPLDTVLTVDNGGLPCRLVMAKLADASPDKATDSGEKNTPSKSKTAAESGEADNMFANRLRKNQRALKGWIKQQNIQAYRLYDADMPEYAVAVDVYHTKDDPYFTDVVVQEYQAPSRVDAQKAQQRLGQILATLPDVLQCEPEAVHLKVRKRQKGSEQYSRVTDSRSQIQKNEKTVMEHGCRLLVNFEDYLDTGLFLDHRKVRHYIQAKAQDKRFLNLFGYTGAATVHAINGGAASSLTVDMSNNYLDWAARNIELNGGDPALHRTERADCLEWLAVDPPESLYDLILLDPPTFSNSARMENDCDVQRDHAGLIAMTMKRLAPDGLLIFSNNFRRFKLDESTLSTFGLENRTEWSLDRDFQRNRRIHQCWFIRHV